MTDANRFVGIGRITGENLQKIVGKMMYAEVISKQFVDKVLHAIRQELNADGHFSDASIDIDTSSGNLVYEISFIAKDESVLLIKVTTMVAT